MKRLDIELPAFLSGVDLNPNWWIGDGLREFARGAG